MKQRADRGIFSRLLKNKSLLADMGIFAVAVSWGLNFNVMKWALSDITPLYYLAIRFLLTALLMGIFFFRKVFKPNKRDVVSGALTGIFLAACFAAQTIGLQFTTPGNSGFISNASVVMVPLFSWLIYKKRPPINGIIGAIVAFIGLALISVTDDMRISPGDLLALLSAFFFALQIMTVDRFTGKGDAIRMVVYQVFVAGAVCLIFAGITEPLPQLSIKNPSVLVAIAYGVVFCTALSFLIQAFAQKVTPPSHVAIILCFEAVFALLFSLPAGYGDITMRGGIGCCIVLCGFILAEKKSVRSEKMFQK